MPRADVEMIGDSADPEQHARQWSVSYAPGLKQIFILVQVLMWDGVLPDWMSDSQSTMSGARTMVNPALYLCACHMDARCLHRMCCCKDCALADVKRINTNMADCIWWM